MTTKSALISRERATSHEQEQATITNNNTMDSIDVNNFFNEDRASIDSQLWVDGLLEDAEMLETSDDPPTMAVSIDGNDEAKSDEEEDIEPLPFRPSEWQGDVESDHQVPRQMSGNSLDGVHAACIPDVAAAQQTLTQPITVPSCFDVVNGCGRGILRLPGNETYRELVSLSKRIYASCHHLDKGKVSQGIVAAIRDSGGRFLEYDKQSKTYHDIGNIRAWKKTSQALREGLKGIRKLIYSDMAAGRDTSGLDIDFLGTLNVPLPAERYVAFSVHMMQVLRGQPNG
jgi:hypothetical protein